MNPKTGRLIASSLACSLLVGCASQKPRAVPSPASRPVLSANAAKTLEQIQPAEALPKPIQPATIASTRPSLESVELFAQARGALAAHERFTALQLLNRALLLDPDSYELNMAMGQAAAGTNLSARALPAFEHAAQINPDSVDAYLEIARQHMQAAHPENAIRPLRLAQQTTGYRNDSDAAIAVDFYLARALQMGGYDTAALHQYESLMSRLERLGPGYRGPPEVMQMVRSPDLLFGEIALVAGRIGEYGTAINAIDQALLEAPGNRQYAILRIKLLQDAGRSYDARQFAIEMVSSYGPSVEVMSVVRDAFAKAGGDRAVTAALQSAIAKQPKDANIGFALADYLQRSGNSADAQDILRGLVRELNYRPDTVSHLYELYESQGQLAAAAKLVIEASAKRPEDLNEHAARISQLARLSRSNHLRLRDLQAVTVEPWAEAAKLYWVAQLGTLWGRDEAARAALEKAVRLAPPYPPAYRALLNHYWARPDWDDMRKAATSEELIALAKTRGSNALAAELRGMLALERKRPAEASEAFLEAMRLGDTDPELQLGYALVQKMQGNYTETERSLLKINEDFPQFEHAYVALLNFYQERSLPTNMLRTLQKWLAADPQNVSARLSEAHVFFEIGRIDAAEKILLDLFNENADNQAVLAELQNLYDSARRRETFIRLLEQKRQGRPDIREVAARLVAIYQAQSRLTEAARVLDDLRKSAQGDSDLLYFLSSLYMTVGDNASAERTLESVLAIDPHHASAANDLGYFMADSNRDLDRAQRLIEIAVKEEPDNQAYLDSFGWVMYKRGRFDVARDYLMKAIAQTVEPDPIVLDHLGDANYRLGREADAVRFWEDSAKHLNNRELRSKEYQVLALQLQNKLQNSRRKLPVQTAPTAAETPSKTSVTAP